LRRTTCRCGGAEVQRDRDATARSPLVVTTASTDRRNDPPVSGDHCKTLSSDCPMKHCSVAERRTTPADLLTYRLWE